MMARTVSASQFEVALGHHERGEFEHAERLYAQALVSQPDNVQAVHSAGVLALQRGQSALAVSRLQRAIELGVNLSGTFYMLGRAQKGIGKLDEAIVSYQRAVALDPALADVYISLAIVLRQRNRLDEAEQACRRALGLQPDSFEARLNLANILQTQRQLDAALVEYERAEAIRPDSDELHYNFGKLLRALNRNEDAAQRFQQAVLKNDRHWDAYYNLGNTLNDLKQHVEAIECYRFLLNLMASGAGLSRDALSKDDLLRDAKAGMAAAMIWCYRYEEALQLLREALRHAPESIPLLEHLLVVLPYRFTENREVQQTYNQYQRFIPLRGVPSLLALNTRSEPPTRLRIAYLSGDFRDHSVSFFLEPILAQHDKQTFEVVCYSSNKTDDEVTARLRGYADKWLDAIELSDRQLAERIVADQIDILVDLSGRTLGNRLGVMAHRPALLQVGYLGYPTYTGVHQIAYRLTDPVIDPVDDVTVVTIDSEQAVRLPTSMFCYRPSADAPEISERRYDCARPLCFGSFNQVPKISPETIAAWVSILNAVPDSHLLLKSFGFSDEAVRERTLRAFSDAGLAAERIAIRAGEPERRNHLALYGEVDIVLDTFPYNGATTTCEALWMGVPVVTLLGETHASRVGASILRAMSLDELVATTVPDYVSTAVSLANNTRRLREFHAGLRQQFAASPLRDERGFTQHFEQLLRDAWHQEQQLGSWKNIESSVLAG